MFKIKRVHWAGGFFVLAIVVFLVVAQIGFVGKALYCEFPGCKKCCMETTTTFCYGSSSPGSGWAWGPTPLQGDGWTKSVSKYKVEYLADGCPSNPSIEEDCEQTNCNYDSAVTQAYINGREQMAEESVAYDAGEDQYCLDASDYYGGILTITCRNLCLDHVFGGPRLPTEEIEGIVGPFGKAIPKDGLGDIVPPTSHQ